MSKALTTLHISHSMTNQRQKQHERVCWLRFSCHSIKWQIFNSIAQHSFITQVQEKLMNTTKNSFVEVKGAEEAGCITTFLSCLWWDKTGA